MKKQIKYFYKMISVHGLMVHGLMLLLMAWGCDECYKNTRSLPLKKAQKIIAEVVKIPENQKGPEGECKKKSIQDILEAMYKTSTLFDPNNRISEESIKSGCDLLQQKLFERPAKELEGLSDYFIKKFNALEADTKFRKAWNEKRSKPLKEGIQPNKDHRFESSLRAFYKTLQKFNEEACIDSDPNWGDNNSENQFVDKLLQISLQDQQGLQPLLEDAIRSYNNAIEASKPLKDNVFPALNKLISSLNGGALATQTVPHQPGQGTQQSGIPTHQTAQQGVRGVSEQSVEDPELEALKQKVKQKLQVALGLRIIIQPDNEQYMTISNEVKSDCYTKINGMDSANLHKLNNEFDDVDNTCRKYISSFISNFEAKNGQVTIKNNSDKDLEKVEELVNLASKTIKALNYINHIAPELDKVNEIEKFLQGEILKYKEILKDPRLRKLKLERLKDEVEQSLRNLMIGGGISPKQAEQAEQAEQMLHKCIEQSRGLSVEELDFADNLLKSAQDTLQEFHDTFRKTFVIERINDKRISIQQYGEIVSASIHVLNKYKKQLEDLSQLIPELKLFKDGPEHLEQMLNNNPFDLFQVLYPNLIP